MVRRVGRMHRLLIGVIGIEIDDAGLMVIDPNDGVVVGQATLRGCGSRGSSVLRWKLESIQN
jgi:hypothetical protein